MSHDKEFYGTFIAVMAGLAVLAVVLVFTANSLTSDVSDYKPEEVIIENIKPVGEVYVAGESEPEAAAPAAAMTTTADAGGAAAPKSGQQVYQQSCQACHVAGVAGAPKLGDKAAWSDRIGKGVDTLVQSAISGVPGTAMLARGSCSTCSDDEIRAAVDYMVSQSR